MPIINALDARTLHELSCSAKIVDNPSRHRFASIGFPERDDQGVAAFNHTRPSGERLKDDEFRDRDGCSL
jgi:hypothetical protein